MERELYKWQEECLERWFSNHGRGMVQAVTGSGKTLLALAAAERLEKTLDRDLLVKIVMPTGALMRQWSRALKEFLGPDAADSIQKEIGLRGGGQKSPPDRKYMIYVINSARYELARQILSDLKKGAAVLLIADECHHYESEQNQLIFEFLPHIEPYKADFFSMGLSATLPGGQAGRYLACALGKKIYDYGIDRAAKASSICKYDVYPIEISFQEEEKEAYLDLTDRMTVLYHRLIQMYPPLKDMGQKERFEMLRQIAGGRERRAAQEAKLYMNLSYKRKSLVCTASARIACAYDLVCRLKEDDKIFIFGERISQAEELYWLLCDKYPGRVGRCHSGMGQEANRNVLARFKEGEVRILIACRAMDEGVDVPDASVGIILSGTSMQRQRTQRLGRIIRKREGKERASLYYLHVAESTEDIRFLPDNGNCRIFELEYLFDERDFYNEPYDKAASILLEKLKGERAGKEKRKEAWRCLQLGCVRADWTLDEGVIDMYTKEAWGVREKNYWICMKKVHKIIGEPSICKKQDL